MLFITRKLAPSVGGMQRHARSLLDHLNLPIDLIGMRSSQLHMAWWLPFAFARGLLCSRAFDVLLVQDALLAPLGVWLARTAHKPLVVVAHGLDVTWPHGWYRAPVHAALRHAEQVLCVSGATLDACREVGVKDERLAVIPNGVESHEGFSSGSRRMLFVGRLIERKGIHWFLREVMPDLGAQVEMDVVGDGPMLSLVKALACENERIRIHGQVSDERLRALYATSGILVMPNLPVKGDMEGFGMAALEAGAWGIPVVAANMEGLRDAVTDRETGLLAPSKNKGAWVRAVHEVMNWDVQKRRNIKTTVLDRFNWKRIAKQYRDRLAAVYLDSKSRS